MFLFKLQVSESLWFSLSGSLLSATFHTAETEHRFPWLILKNLFLSITKPFTAVYTHTLTCMTHIKLKNSFQKKKIQQNECCKGLRDGSARSLPEDPAPYGYNIFNSGESNIFLWSLWATGSHMVHRQTYRRLIHIGKKYLKISFVDLPASDCSVCETSVWGTKIRMLWPLAQAMCIVNRERKPCKASRGQERTFQYEGGVFCLQLGSRRLPLRVCWNLIIHQGRLQFSKCGQFFNRNKLFQCIWHLTCGEESRSCVLTVDEEQRWDTCPQSFLVSFSIDPVALGSPCHGQGFGPLPSHSITLSIYLFFFF